MAKEAHLEELVRQLEGLASSFGRAEKDILAICSRARSGDFRGVLQNTRLVVETLLRAIFAAKKQTPGKQTLEQLLNKLQSDLPTNIQVHTRTIQAWGNVGAHDHSADLFEQGVEFSNEEALASLNSLLVILGWYRDNHLDGVSLPSVPASPAGSLPRKPADVPAPVAAPPPSSNTKVILIGGAVVAVAILGAVVGNLSSTSPEKNDTPDKAALDRTALDAAYAAAKIPMPPVDCRSSDATVVTALADAMGLLAGGNGRSARDQDKKARARLDVVIKKGQMAAEVWTVMARARFFAGDDTAQVLDAIDRATQGCSDWAEPHNLKGNLHIREKDFDAAKGAYERAMGIDATYLAPRFNLVTILLRGGEVEDALALCDAILTQDPNYASAYAMRGRAKLVSNKADSAIADLEKAVRLDPKDGATALVLGQAYHAKKDDKRATIYFCQAKRLGLEAAKPLCPE